MKNHQRDNQNKTRLTSIRAARQHAWHLIESKARHSKKIEDRLVVQDHKNPIVVTFVVFQSKITERFLLNRSVDKVQSIGLHSEKQ